MDALTPAPTAEGATPAPGLLGGLVGALTPAPTAEGATGLVDALTPTAEGATPALWDCSDPSANCRRGPLDSWEAWWVL